MSGPHRIASIRAAARRSGFALLVMAAAACRDDRAMNGEFHRVHTEPTSAEHFEKAWYLLRQLEEFEPEQTMAQITYHLNRWLADQTEPDDWVRDPMMDDASLDYLRGLHSLVHLDTLEFSTRDTAYLRESRWLRDIATWVAASPPPIELADWLAAAPERHGADSARRLGIAARCFDWTIRNIQLDAFPTLPDAAGAAGKKVRSERPAAEAIPGPGYTMPPWQALLLGHGDALQRARIFLLLLRQHGIEGAVLASAPQDSATPVPWAVGVLIGSDLFLFEPELGWPIPGPSDTGIATLSELVESPALLRQLDAGEGVAYRVQESELSRIVALLDVSSESVARRMRLIESGLAGDHRMTLATRPSDTRSALSGLRGISAVAVWRVPLETELFELALTEARRRDSRLDAAYQWQMALFQGLSPLPQARQLHFRRQFDREDEKAGAIVKYMDLRASEADIERLATDPDQQMAHGLRRAAAEPEEAWRERVSRGQLLLRTGKQHASYWLGIAHYEQGEYETAVNWFAKRTLDESPNSPWAPGARYHVGRCFEMLGKFAEARAQYLLDESPQRHGNLLRSRWIRLHKLTDAPPAGDSAGDSAGASSAGRASTDPISTESRFR
ncbi:MAG: tetratricopeptide repeat protein [Planctomycetes bacterium]|nr:tetratricopeptide repeat protein [Planctomycetota bacterium]